MQGERILLFAHMAYGALLPHIVIIYFSSTSSTPGNQMESYLDSLDASKAVILECDNEGCDMVEATHDDEGWHYGDGHSAQKDAEIVMLEKEDTE